MRRALLAVVVLALMACIKSVGGGAERSPTPVPSPPSAVITGGQPTYYPGLTARLSGEASLAGNDTEIAGYLWAMTSHPVGSTAVLTATAAANVDFVLDIDGTYGVELTVTDTLGRQASTTTTLTCAGPPEGLLVQLAWPTEYVSVDMDLHLINNAQQPANAAMWDVVGCTSTNGTGSAHGCDCHWRNCKPSSADVLDWWDPGVTADNPHLDQENIDSTFPEITSIDSPHDGSYEVLVHYFETHISSVPPVPSQVSVYFAGVLATAGTQNLTLTAVDQVWDAGTISFAGGVGSYAPGSSTFVTVPPP
jgi:hypothetical protein